MEGRSANIQVDKASGKHMAGRSANAQVDKATRKAAKDQALCLLIHTLTNPIIFDSSKNKFDLRQLS